MAAKDIFAAIGLGTPFYFAAVTYCFFFWLDRNASAQASRAISGWLEGHPNARIDTRQGVIDMFDHLYTSPLLQVRAFVRSCCVSLAVSLAVWISYFLFYRRLNLRYITSADFEDNNQRLGIYVRDHFFGLHFPICSKKVSQSRREKIINIFDRLYVNWSVHSSNVSHYEYCFVVSC